MHYKECLIREHNSNGRARSTPEVTGSNPVVSTTPKDVMGKVHIEYLTLSKWNMKRVYKLDTTQCKSNMALMKIIQTFLVESGEVDSSASFEKSVNVFSAKEIHCDPAANGYKRFIEDLESIGVSVWDKERIQMPTIEGVSHEPQSYT